MDKDWYKSDIHSRDAPPGHDTRTQWEALAGLPPESTAAIRALLCSTGIPLSGCIVCVKVDEIFLFLVIVIVPKVIII